MGFEKKIKMWSEKLTTMYVMGKAHSGVLKIKQTVNKIVLYYKYIIN